MTSTPISLCAVRAATAAGNATIEAAYEPIFEAMHAKDWLRARVLADALRYISLPVEALASVFELRAFAADTFLAEIAAQERDENFEATGGAA